MFWKQNGYGGTPITYGIQYFSELAVPVMPTGWNDAINSIVFGAA